MKNKILALASSISLVVGIALVSASPALADSHSVVRDSYGGKVRDSFGGCVRTQWMSDRDECATGSTVRSEAAAIIMAMDERVIYFDFDKHAVNGSERDKLDTLAEALKTHNIRAVKVVGYTDRIGSDAYNNSLSHKRATAVKHYLDSKVKLDKSVVHLRGLGKDQQVKGCEDIHKRADLIECLAPNRRVEIEVDYFDGMR